MSLFENDTQRKIYFYLKLYEDMNNGEKIINTFDIFEFLSKRNRLNISFAEFHIYKESIETLFEILNFLENTYPTWGKRIGQKLYEFFYMECDIKTQKEFINTFNNNIKIKGVSEKYINVIRNYLNSLCE